MLPSTTKVKAAPLALDELGVRAESAGAVTTGSATWIFLFKDGDQASKTVTRPRWAMTTWTGAVELGAMVLPRRETSGAR